MKKRFLFAVFLGKMLASDSPKNIIPGASSCGLIKLDQFSKFNLDTTQIESQTPSNDQWSEKLTSIFNIWIDFSARTALINHKKIQQTRDLEMVRRNWPHNDKFTMMIRAEREKILSDTKTEIKLDDKQNVTDPINLEAFGYLFNFTLPSALTCNFICQGLIVNPSNRDFFRELSKTGCFSKSYKSSLIPAFNRLLSADYRLLSICKS